MFKSCVATHLRLQLTKNMTVKSMTFIERIDSERLVDHLAKLNIRWEDSGLLANKD